MPEMYAHKSNYDPPPCPEPDCDGDTYVPTDSWQWTEAHDGVGWFPARVECEECGRLYNPDLI